MSMRVPDGISAVDAFCALYKNASVIGVGQLHPAAGEAPGSRWNAVQIFQTYCHSGYCHSVRGKFLKVNFRKFPEIDVAFYDEQYGKGAAEKAIQEYQKTMDKPDPEENYDLRGKPCHYFTSFWKQKTAVHQRKDLAEMFSKCEKLEEAEKRIDEEISKTKPPGFIFGRCKVRYALVSPVDYSGHSYKPCKEALDHFKTLLQSNQHNETNVEGFSICNYNRFFPFLQKCRLQTDVSSLETARKILESQLPKV